MGCLAAGVAHADNVVVVTDVVGKQSSDVVAALVAQRHSVRVQGVDEALVADGAAVLAVGKKSAHKLEAENVGKRAALLISNKDAPAQTAAVVVDVPLATQLPWIARALPGRPRLVVARQPARNDIDAGLLAAAAAAGLVVDIVDVKAPGEAVPAVEAALSRPGAKAILLLIADDVVVTADTIAPLMQAAFRARVPVVGFSAYFAKVGAVAVVTADVATAATEALALALAQTSSSCAPACPHVTSASARLVVDGRLAGRLGIPVQDGPHIEVRR